MTQPRPYDGRSAEVLREAGYFVVSRKFGHVSRIDRSSEEYRRWALGQDRGRLGKNNGSGWRDYYRRCVSHDVMLVPESIRKQLPNSGDDRGGSEGRAEPYRYSGEKR